jgi:hypothetical protein
LYVDIPAETQTRSSASIKQTHEEGKDYQARSWHFLWKNNTAISTCETFTFKRTHACFLTQSFPASSDLGLAETKTHSYLPSFILTKCLPLVNTWESFI